MRIYELGNITS